ncbi:MAG: hypothetical protein AAGK97_14080, partial [Bacteroidota bacterium]
LVDTTLTRDFLENNENEIEKEFFEKYMICPDIDGTDLLDEFYDNHLTLSTNRKTSYRLFAPIYLTVNNKDIMVEHVWHSQIENKLPNIIGAKIQSFNGKDINSLIEDFPSYCSDKTNAEVREWIANKIIAGRYSEPRVLSLEMENGQLITLDIDTVRLKSSNELLQHYIKDNIGYKNK